MLALLSPYASFLFYFTPDGFFRRGPLIFVMILILYLYLGGACVLIVIKRKAVTAVKYYTLLSFCLTPMMMGTIQAFSYGVTLVWPAMTLTMLLIHLNIQSQILNTDYLTGLYNRRQLDKYMLSKIESKRPDSTIAAIMMDIDNFKSINDLYGHKMGDEALETMALILKKVFSHNDFIARYAGDEFVVVMDLQHENDINPILKRLNNNLDHFNKNSGSPYDLSISYGVDIYHEKTHMTADKFLHHLDELMYYNKRRKKILQVKEQKTRRSRFQAIDNKFENESPTKKIPEKAIAE
jgi:diguanylate cyclase (GGDEF)-like protein